MPRFPRNEPELAALALVVAQGLREAPEDFPAPPVPADELQARLDSYHGALTAAITAEATLREQHAVKDDALEELIDGVKANLRYAEVAVRDQPAKLNQVGWGAPGRGSALSAPGEVRDMGVKAEGDDWVLFDWKQPVDGGSVAMYRIQRRKAGGRTWELVDTAVETEHLLRDQPRGVDLEYRVIAVNKAGSGKPSGMVALVL